jgi:DNA-binding beta-propeller fold protein YncE
MKHCGGCKHSPSTQYCPECEVDQLARNRYFTGKLLVERDFTDEQRYFLGKHRRHNQRLHGWGVVCGLRVKQHPNPACRSQYVIIEPGYAVDCCGREIVIEHEQTFDFRARFECWWREQHGEESEPDDLEHTLQICVRYRECPTEETPSLFGDCGCGDTDSQHGRILDSYEFDLLVDATTSTPDDPLALELAWSNTLNIADTRRVLVDESNSRVYVLAGDTSLSLSVYNTANHSLLATFSLPEVGLDMALSVDGAFLYLSLLKERNNGQVAVLDTAQIGVGAPEINRLTIDNSVSDTLPLAVSGAGRLYLLNPAQNELWAWNNPNADTDTDAERLGPFPTGADATALALSPDDSRVFVAIDGAIKVLESADLNAAATITLTDVTPSALATVATTGDARLFIADHDNQTIRLHAIQPSNPTDPYPALSTPMRLTHAPVALLPSAGGRRLYVLVEDTSGNGFVQAVDAHALELNSALVTSEVPVGDGAAHLALGEGGHRLYAAFGGSDAVESSGGVAIIDVTTVQCKDIFLTMLDACPGCEGGDCLALATLVDYVYGNEAVDSVAGGGQVALNNWRDRKLLPSVDLLFEVVKCLLEQDGEGEGGEQCPPRPTGPAGPQGETGPADPQGGTSPTGPQGPVGPIENPVLTHICAINWNHGKPTQLQEISPFGLLIAFDKPVLNGDIHHHSFIVLRNDFNEENEGSDVTCWCEMTSAQLNGVNFANACEISRFDVVEQLEDYVNGAQFFPATKFARGREYRVIVKGDFIRDIDGLAVDADHLPPWLPNDVGRVTGDQIEGGTFESWFRVE